mmetsp:Transcript_41978/g.67521  ORF Transcript_41978/g.67521 Transcript_41978/m.67521 type:complete len:139 (-) Transcript_41978:168-584(-)
MADGAKKNKMKKKKRYSRSSVGEMPSSSANHVVAEDTADIKFLEVNIAEAAVPPGSSFYVRAPDGVLIRVVAPTYKASDKPSPIITVQYSPPPFKKKPSKAMGRKKKRARDPGAPKKARNAYMLFCSEMRLAVIIVEE